MVPLLLLALLLLVTRTAAAVSAEGGSTSSSSHYYNYRQRRPSFFRMRRSSVLRVVTIWGGGSSVDDETNDQIKAKSSSATANDEDDDNFVWIGDEVLHDNWRKLVRRRVQLPSKMIADFELVGQKGTDEAVLVFVWNTKTKTATLIREYMPSMHAKMMGLAAGVVEDKHQRDTSSSSGQQQQDDDDDDDDDVHLTAAQHELEEECHMKGGTWILLTQNTNATATTTNGDGGTNNANNNKVPIYMDKYSTTRLCAYLVLDATPIPESEAKPRDETEQGMEVVHGVSIEEVYQLISSGQMTVVGAWASLLALNKLRDMGQIK